MSNYLVRYRAGRIAGPAGPSPYRTLTNSFMNRIRSARRSAFSGSRTRTAQRRKRYTSGIGVTEQHDARLIYRKRRMPSFRKRRWKIFKRKVLAVSEKDLGTQQVVFNSSYTFTNNVAGYQSASTSLLYPLQSTTTYANDLNNISGFIAGAATTVATGLAVSPSTKILFQSGILDITMRNASTYYDGTTFALDSRARMEVDVYECTSGHTAEEIGSTYSTPLNTFATNISNTDPIGGGATTELRLDLRGCTPFDLSYALSRFKIKIWSKRKYQVSNNDQITYQVRDPRRHSLVYREMSNQDGWNKPGLTRFVIIIAKISPGLTVGNTAGTFQENMVVGTTRKYTFKVENWTEDRSAYLTV